MTTGKSRLPNMTDSRLIGYIEKQGRPSMATIQRNANVKFYDQETGALLDTHPTTYEAFACDVCGKWEMGHMIPNNWYRVERIIDFPRNEKEEAHICSMTCLLDYAKGKVNAKEEVAA